MTRDRPAAAPARRVVYRDRSEERRHLSQPATRVCDGAMRIIACIEDPVVIEKMLTHFDAKAAACQSSPLDERGRRTYGREGRSIRPILDHDCAANQVLLSWSAPDVFYGKVCQRGKSTLIGSPPAPVAAELETLWKKQFRSQPK